MAQIERGDLELRPELAQAVWKGEVFSLVPQLDEDYEGMIIRQLQYPWEAEAYYLHCPASLNEYYDAYIVPAYNEMFK